MISKKINLKLSELLIFNIEHKSNFFYLSVVAFYILKFSNNFVAYSLENSLKFSAFEWNIRQICFAL